LLIRYRFGWVKSSVADPDPAFYLNADPDPAFYLNADPKSGRQANTDSSGS
jgi:hypothetical protein